MSPALDVLAIVAGVVIIVATVGSAVRTTVLPRAIPDRISRLALVGVRTTYRLRAGRHANYERRDHVMAMLGPVTLLSTLAMWLVLVILGYTLLYLGTTTSSPRRALELSGSSVFTLGIVSEHRLGPDLLVFSEAGLGLLLLTLLITYLPSIYTAFSRRERGVGLMAVRAGQRPEAVAMLKRYHLIEDPHYRLSELWRTWEGWFVDVEETHGSFPILAFFRSPRPESSWINSAGALLDSASLWLSSVEHPRDPDANLCIRAGFLCLRSIAGSFGIGFNPDPAQTDPITIARDEFDEALDELADAGVPILDDRDQCWRDFAGWRVNYDTVLLELARMVEAPPAPWVSDRSPLQTHRKSRRRKH